MRIRTQFIVNTVFFSIVLLVSASIVIVTDQRIQNTHRNELLALKIQQEAYELSYLADSYLIYRETTQAARWESRFASLSKDLSSMSLYTPEQRALVDNLKRNRRRLGDVFEDVKSQLHAEQTIPEPGTVEWESVQVSWSRMAVQNQGMIFDVSQLALMLRDEEDRLRQTTGMLNLILIGLFGAFLLANYAITYRRALRSISVLQNHAGIIGTGNLDHVISVERNDEIGNLADSFNAMTANLRNITASKEELEKEIAERKRAEAALLETSDYLEKLIDFANAPIIVWNPGFIITRFNNAFERLTGYEADEMLGKHLRILFPKASREQSLGRIEKTLAGEYWESVEIPILCKDGEERIALWNSANIYSDSGEETLVATIAQGQDITVRKRAEEILQEITIELERSNEELEQFAYIASHDLQEPLRMVTSYLQLIEKRYKDKLDSDADEFIAYAVDGAKRMQEMIEGLLRYSRVTTQSEPFDLVDCTLVVEQAIGNLERAINDSQAVITYDTLPIVFADRAQLMQVFQNLISNAINFSGDKPPQIQIGVVREETESIFYVKDNGIGFDSKNASRIFSIFERLNEVKRSGTGIGLAVCKRIVERHGGRIWAESKPGHGSTFFFTIPDQKKDRD